MNGEKYRELFNNIYDLINREIDLYTLSDRKQFLKGMYPKFVLMYEFLRMLRGEAFVDVRPKEAVSYQKDYYRMENELRVRLENIKANFDPNDEFLHMKIKDMQKNFDY